MPEVADYFWVEDWEQWGICSRRPSESDITALPGGLTNQCYLLACTHNQKETGHYVVRVSAENSSKLNLNRDAEYLIQQYVADSGLTAPVIFSSENHRYWIREYLSGDALTPDIAQNPDLIRYLLNELKTLHQLPVPDNIPVISIPEKAEYYWSLLEEQNPEDETLPLKPVLQVTMSEPPAGNFCLCHMDPLLANWVFTASGPKLIDWEYSGAGHPYWDLAVLFQELLQELLQGSIHLYPDITDQGKEQLATDLERLFFNEYGISDERAWRKANIQMEYLSSLWYRAQS